MSTELSLCQRCKQVTLLSTKDEYAEVRACLSCGYIIKRVYSLEDIEPVFNHSAYKQMWEWIIKNPACEKEDWPGWATNGGAVCVCTNNCFACHAAIHYQYWHNRTMYMTRKSSTEYKNMCGVCPIDWKTKNRSCEHMNNQRRDYKGVFSQWLASIDNKKARYYARRILNLPIKAMWEGMTV